MDEPIQYVLDFGELSETEFIFEVPYTQEQTILSSGTAIIKISGLTAQDALEKWKNSPEDYELIDGQEHDCEILDSADFILEIDKATLDQYGVE